MTGFVDLLVIEGPDDGMRYTLESGTYRVLGRLGDPSDSTVQMDREGDRLLDPEQQRVVDSMASRGVRTRFKKRGADILVDDGSVSRTHAVVFADEHGASVADLMSTNGTKVNGSPIDDVDLQDGDVIQVGQTKLKADRS